MRCCRLPGREIQGAGHFGPNTHADAVAAALAGFIGTVRETALGAELSR